MKKIVIFIMCIIFCGSIFNSYAKNIPIPRIKPNYYFLTSEQKNEVDCLAGMIYQEALNQSERGQIAVGVVAINRTKLDVYPDTICEVIKHKMGKKCQYTWYCDPKRKQIFYDKLHNDEDIIFNDLIKLSTYIFLNHPYMIDPSKSAIFFHSKNVSPKWKNVSRTVEIGNHVFYTRKNLSKNI